MMRGAAQEAELHLKQAIAALNTTPEVRAGHSRQTGDTALDMFRCCGQRVSTAGRRHCTIFAFYRGRCMCLIRPNIGLPK